VGKAAEGIDEMRIKHKEIAVEAKIIEHKLSLVFINVSSNF
jgi:hypothetical protein